jgi:hypothetical protein
LRETLALFPRIGATRCSRHLPIHFDGYRLCQVEINVIQNVDIGLVDNWVLAMTKFETNGVKEVGLFICGKRIVENLGLAEVLLELFATRPFLDTLQTLCVSIPL